MAKATPRWSAQVYLRSAKGSLRDLGDGPLPADLASRLPPSEKRREVAAAFEKLGFRVFLDDLGLGVSIDGPESLFNRVFKTGKAKTKARAAAGDTRELTVPKDLAALVESIVVLPAPESFR